MTDEFEVKYSPLCRDLTSQGKTVEVHIYEGDGDGWILEIVDEFGNSTVWDDEFETDQKALDEAIKCVFVEGIDKLIGPGSGYYH